MARRVQISLPADRTEALLAERWAVDVAIVFLASCAIFLWKRARSQRRSLLPPASGRERRRRG